MIGRVHSYRAANEVELAEDQIAIAISDGAFGSHLGIVYRLGDAKPILLHLAFHQDLTQEAYPPTGKWLVYVMDIDPLLAVQLVSVLDAMAARYQGSNNGGIDYGINLYDSLRAVSGLGVYSPQGASDGLTCASFVAAVFEAMHVPLVEIGTWEVDAVNVAWGDAVICFLKVHGKASQAHISSVIANNNGLRLRPDEVAGSAINFVPGKPKQFKELQPMARVVSALLRTYCGPANRGNDIHAYGRCQKSYYATVEKIEELRMLMVAKLQALRESRRDAS